MISKFFWLKTHGIEAGAGQEGFGREGFDQGPDFGGLDPGSGASGAGGQGIGGGGIGLSEDSGGGPQIGVDFAAPESITRQDLSEFSAFSEQLDTFAEQFTAALGFGPEATAAVKRGAELADPEAFSRGVKTGVGFELASAFAGLTGLPTSVAVGILDRTVAAFANPAFRAGRESINNPLGSVAPVVGTAAGVAAGSIGLARALELGVNVAGIATQVPESLRGDVPATPPATEREMQDTGRQRTAQDTASRSQAQPAALGARITTSTDQDFQRLRSELRPREAFSRAALRIARTT